jgi:hypothetical protein
MNDVFSDLNNTGVEFLIIELDLASTFLDIADASRLEETKCRNHKNARRAYDTVLAFLPKLTMNEVERQLMESRLTLLKTRLEAVRERL